MSHNDLKSSSVADDLIDSRCSVLYLCFSNNLHFLLRECTLDFNFRIWGVFELRADVVCVFLLLSSKLGRKMFVVEE